MVAFSEGRVGLEEQLAWFEYTHLAERLQLLTLIIIGEGVIGMVKSVACITKGQTSNNISETGTVVAAIPLLVCE
ncbi:hypothetical protein J4E91_005949 [Alternaria rosae]|nr:hypothetical protein J4E91_005949 [Alternaria rosae]